ncbi:MAG TPA: aldehyde dehydrogenase family protein [bacterium]|nr:aldehyde dehydrogenase family protein [bacterium]
MLKVMNPATGALIQELAEDGPAQVAAKFQAACLAQKAWAAGPLERRLAVIQAFRGLIAARLETLARILSSEVGKPIRQSRNELNGLLGRLDFFLGAAAGALADETVFSDPTVVERIRREPLGVVANISAWNYPYFVSSNVAVPALLAGNAVLFKPSEYASLSGLAMTQALHDAGVPQDLFQVLLGGAATGAALLEQPLDGVFFTGSYATGQRIAQAAAGRMIKVQLELGGKDPVYVRADVDVRAAAAGLADGAFYNTGQSCCSVERLYVHASVYDAFVEAFVAEVKTYAQGDPMDEATYLGAITRPSHLDYLEHQVVDAVARGAKLLLGGKVLPGPGARFEATVLAHVDHSMELMREESFGPLIGIQKVADDAEAVALMNDTPYGLTAGVYTKDQAAAEAVLAQVNAGSAYWNCCDRVSPRLPWSGRGHSGMGVVLSNDGIQTFTRPKAWHLKQA